LGPLTAADYAISDTLVAFWSNFAKHGDPNGEGLAVWPGYTHVGEEGGRFLGLGNGIAGVEYGLGRLRFIRGLRGQGEALAG
jgi:hypothetical protein